MIDETHKNREHKIKSQKGKVNRRSSIRGTQRFTKPSPTADYAKVQINSALFTRKAGEKCTEPMFLALAIGLCGARISAHPPNEKAEETDFSHYTFSFLQFSS